MTTSNIATQRKSWPQANALTVSRYITDLNSGKLNRVDTHPEDSIWKSFLAAHPIIKFQRPDFFLIFRYTDSCTILHQENISLDLGGAAVNFENICKALVPDDLRHIRETDKI